MIIFFYFQIYTTNYQTNFILVHILYEFTTKSYTYKIICFYFNIIMLHYKCYTINLKHLNFFKFNTMTYFIHY